MRGSLVSVLAFALMLVVGYFYTAAGLVIPPPALYGIWLLWLGLASLQVRVRRQPRMALAMPAIALVALVSLVAVGEALWGWTA